MDTSYVPAGSWVRVRSAHSGKVELQGRWHLSTEDPRFRFSLGSSRAIVACGRSVAASSNQGTDLAIAFDLPRSHVCSICSDRYIRDRLFEIHVHNLTATSPS